MGRSPLQPNSSQMFCAFLQLLSVGLVSRDILTWEFVDGDERLPEAVVVAQRNFLNMTNSRQ